MVNTYGWAYYRPFRGVVLMGLETAWGSAPTTVGVYPSDIILGVRPAEAGEYWEQRFLDPNPTSYKSRDNIQRYLVHTPGAGSFSWAVKDARCFGLALGTPTGNTTNGFDFPGTASYDALNSFTLDYATLKTYNSTNTQGWVRRYEGARVSTFTLRQDKRAPLTAELAWISEYPTERTSIVASASRSGPTAGLAPFFSFQGSIAVKGTTCAYVNSWQWQVNNNLWGEPFISDQYGKNIGMLTPGVRAYAASMEIIPTSTTIYGYVASGTECTVQINSVKATNDWLKLTMTGVFIPNARMEGAPDAAVMTQPIAFLPRWTNIKWRRGSNTISW